MFPIALQIYDCACLPFPHSTARFQDRNSRASGEGRKGAPATLGSYAARTCRSRGNGHGGAMKLAPFTDQATGFIRPPFLRVWCWWRRMYVLCMAENGAMGGVARDRDGRSDTPGPRHGRRYHCRLGSSVADRATLPPPLSPLPVAVAAVSGEGGTVLYIQGAVGGAALDVHHTFTFFTLKGGAHEEIGDKVEK